MITDKSFDEKIQNNLKFTGAKWKNTLFAYVDSMHIVIFPIEPITTTRIN